MEIFKNTNFDFLAKKWPFIIASLVLTAAGLASLIAKGGPRYGIDFRGGTLMTVKFLGRPPVDQIRSSLSRKIPGEITVQTFEAGSNEVAIGTEIKNERELDAERRTMADVLQSTFGQPNSGKLDFNNASQQALVDRIREPLQRNGAQLSEDQLHRLAADMLAFRNTPPRSGLISSFDQLAAVPGVNAAIISTLKQECYLAPFAVRSRSGRPQGGGGPSAAGHFGHHVRAARDAGLHSIPVRMDLWSRRRHRGLSRHDYHGGYFFLVQQGDLPDRDRRAFDPGGLLHERHHRHF